MAGGRSFPSISRTSKPSHSGICTSRKSKSGFATRISPSAWAPEAHSLTLPISGSARKRMERLLRARGSSSTIRARILAGCSSVDTNSLPGLSRGGCNKRQGHCCFHASGLLIVKAQLERISVQAFEPRAYVRDPNARRARLPSLRQVRAIVIDAQSKGPVHLARRDPNCSAMHAFRDAVLDRVLHHRLQDQAGNLRRKQFLGDIHTELKTVGEARLLDIEILLRELQLFFERDLLPVGILHHAAQEVAQSRDHTDGVVVPLLAHQ